MHFVLAVSDTVELVKAVVWPVVLGLIGWRLYPTVRRVVESRGFTVKAGGAEITVQQASDQLAGQVDDLRLQVSSLRAQLESLAPGSAADGSASRIASRVAQLRRILWVDDHPENNAYEVAALRGRGVQITTVKSTSEAEDAIASGQPVDVIVTDMGREEDGGFHPHAGLELIEHLHAREPSAPVVVYTSAAALSRVREQALAAGAYGATASGTELLDLLSRLGCGDAQSPRPSDVGAIA
jgi:CheY-like chemotaxis protein